MNSAVFDELYNELKKQCGNTSSPIISVFTLIKMIELHIKQSTNRELDVVKYLNNNSITLAKEYSDVLCQRLDLDKEKLDKYRILL